MATPLLTTKLYIPPPRPERVPRPRLIERLNTGTRSGRKLTLISAPAGFGKTTLLSEWVSQCSTPVAWLSLEEGDNDLARFLSYVISALQTVHPDVGQATLAMLQSTQLPPAESLRNVLSSAEGLTALLNDIAAIPPVEKSPCRPLTLVLDDYHLVDIQSIHRALTFLLEHLPPWPRGMHLLIASRTDPPLPLPRLRVRGQLTELRSADLRFTLDEAAAFLNRVMSLDLSTDDVAALEARTEGWVAGLQMAALSMQGRRDVRGFVRAFTGSHRYILDYLADEVLKQQPEQVQTFLLQTSVLERLTGGLCAAVCGASLGETGRDDSSARLTASSQATLEMLERANLFVVPLDDERRWYRYHHLFADLLRYRLDQAMPGQAQELHRRACEWYAGSGRVYEAMGHALAGEDFERAARLVEETDPATMVMRGEVTTLLGWLDALPDEVVRSRPRLSLSFAWALYVTINMDAIEPRLQDALRALGVADTDEGHWPEAPSSQVETFLGEVAALRAFVALYRDDAQRAITLAQRAFDCLSEDNVLMLSALASILGDAHRRTDNVAAAGQSYAESVTYSQAANHTLLTMTITNDLARLQVVQGKLRQAAETFERVLDWASGRRRSLFPVGQAFVGLGDLLRERNDLDAAENYLLQGIAQCELGGYMRYLLFGYVALARVKGARGDVDAMTEWLEKAQQLAERMGLRRFITLVAAHQARLWLMPHYSSVSMGAGRNLAAAIHWARTCGLSAEDQPSYSNEVEYLTLARALIAEGRKAPHTAFAPLAGRDILSSALGLLARLLQAAERSGRVGSVIEILALQAVARWANSQLLASPAETGKAMIALTRALTFAEPEGYVRLFVDEGAPMAKLLRRAASRGILTDYVGRLLEAFGEMREAALLAPHVLDESLTEREFEVLRLLAAGLSNREISNELSITLSTVKSHTGSIYGKLDVGSRTQAVARARKWNLL